MGAAGRLRRGRSQGAQPCWVTAMLTSVRRWCRAHGLPAAGDHVLCAVSGGADSTALAHALARLAGELAFALSLAHVNHELRGAESERDQRAVEQLAADLGVPLLAGRRPPARSGGSPEERLRVLRLEFLTETAGAVGANRIALAHTRDDQAETVILRMAAGTSLAGLAAMAPVSRGGRLIRPLLAVSRADVRAWLESEGLGWVEDSSNAELRYRRNRVRHIVLPALAIHLNPRVTDALCRLADDAAETTAWLSECGNEALERAVVHAGPGQEPPSRPPVRPGAPDVCEIRVGKATLRSYHAVIRRVALRTAYERVRGGRRHLARRHVLTLDQLLWQVGECHLPGDVVAIADSECLSVRRRTADRPNRVRPVPATCRLDLPGPTRVDLQWAKVSLTVRTRPISETEHVARQPGGSGADPPVVSLDGRREAVFDADDLEPPLEVRSWRFGDRFRPFGGPGRRKLSDLFGEARVPVAERHRVPILSDGRGILWVVGLRRSARAPVTRRTERVVEVTAETLGIDRTSEARTNDDAS